MRCLTLTEPWSYLVAVGMKRNETRSWKTSYRGPLAIHAGIGFPREAREVAAEFAEEYGIPDPDELPRGAIIAVCTLADVKRVEDCGVSVLDDEWDFGDYSHGRFAWMLRDVRRLTPIPMKGKLGLWTCDDALIASALSANDTLAYDGAAG